MKLHPIHRASSITHCVTSQQEGALHSWLDFNCADLCVPSFVHVSFLQILQQFEDMQLR